MPNAVDTDHDSVADGAEDVDNDGLTNLQEQELGTSPTEPDTDGDGVNDGTEVAQGGNPLVADQPRAPPTPGNLPPITPVPSDTDTDGDGVPDLVEEDDGTATDNLDSDGDGLSDGEELEWGISGLSQDSDGDGLRDDYEVAHAVDQGLDPGRPDEQISKWTYVTDFLLGMSAGDFAMKDSMAWLAGNLCSGGLSFIPVVGWILGGLADIRDTIAAAIHGDWVGAGLSILGLIPYAGDAVALPAKAAKFVAKYIHRLSAVARFVAKYDKIPDIVKELTFQLIMPEVWAAFVEPEGLTATVSSGRITKPSFDRLLRGERTDLKKLHEEVFPLPNHVDGLNVDWVYNWPMAETRLQELMAALGKTGHYGKDKLYFKRPDLPDLPENARGRYPDFTEEDGNGDFTLHEVKAGIPSRGEEDLIQCKKDAWYKDPASQAKIQEDNPWMRNKKIVGVHWHFMPHGGGPSSNPYNSLGVPADLLKCLVDNNIPFTIHFPAN